MAIINEFIYYLDIFKIPMYLLFNSKMKIPSKFSCFISICISVFLVIFFFQSDLFKKKSPISSVQSIATSSRPALNFNSLNFGVAFGLTDNENKFYGDKSYKSYFSIFMAWYYFSSSGELMASDYKELENCKESDLVSHGSAFKDLGLKDAFCPTKSNFTLEGYWDEKATKYVEISVVRCDNETEICKSDEEIYEFFQNKYLNIYFSDNIIDVNNYLQPIKKIYKNRFFLMDSKMSKKITFNFKKVQFINDDGIIFSDENTIESFMFGNTETDYMSNDLTWIGSILLYSSPEIYVVTRRYQKLQEVIANLGGLANSLLIFGYLLTYLEKEYILFTTVIKNLYNDYTKDFEQNLLRENHTKTKSPLKLNFINKLTRKLPFIEHIQNPFKKRRKAKVFEKPFANKLDSIKKKEEIQKNFKLKSFLGINFLRFLKIKYLSGVLKLKEKDKLLLKAIEVFKKDIDVLQILKKLQEVDKMKKVSQLILYIINNYYKLLGFL